MTAGWHLDCVYGTTEDGYDTGDFDRIHGWVSTRARHRKAKYRRLLLFKLIFVPALFIEPDVLRPGIVGMRGSISTRLRPCKIMSTTSLLHFQ